ncbi:unnamed protein product [Porites lobata]|uniref:G-protein coupled receptors family 1 profile domain-containing protein n=1 Tax=Porites lobata TaxID=104759 RepID=A0ABN8NIA1_9CNID|nr:unnamed protein product [Porites lobata]
MKIEQNTDNIAFHTVEKAYFIQSILFGFASYFGVVLLTVDRFLAIHLHLRYQELVTYKRVVAVVISVWLLSALISFLSSGMAQVALSIVLGTILVVCVVITGILYCKIYAAVRHHTSQIHALQVQQEAQNEDMANVARQRKTALATFYVYVVFLACYLPISGVQLATISGETALLSNLCYFTMTLVHLNSSLNPLIYCWKMRHIRQKFFKGTVYIMAEETKDAFSTSYRMAETGDFYSTLVANYFFNAFLLFTALVLNIITIRALRKISSFPKPLKTLLLSLAISDLGVGLIVQPLYIAGVIMTIEQSANKSLHYTLYTAQRLFGYLLCVASFLGIIALTVDRFLAIHLHLRYQELVTHNRVVAVVISVWVLCLCISLFAFNRILEKVLVIIIATFGAVCFITTGLIYFKIYSIVRHHTNQIHALQLQPVGQNQNGELANAARLKKTTLATFYVYVVFVVCFLPYICVKAADRIYGESELRLHLLYYSTTLVYLNSSLNPLIYCWKMRNIRKAVISVLRNIFQGQRQHFFKGIVYIMTESKDTFSTSFRMVGIEGFYSTLVATCSFNAFLLFTALVLNIITIQALRKIPSFPKPLKTFLISLAVSDLGVGLLVHPLHIARLLIAVESANQRLYNTRYTQRTAFLPIYCVPPHSWAFSL